MVPLIEDQVHRYLIEQEEKRCQAIEAKSEVGSVTRKRRTRRKIPKPQVRVSKHALCQDIEILQMITEFDYDLTDKSFQNYCMVRGLLHIAGEPGSPRWEYFGTPGKKKGDYLADPYFQFAVEIDGAAHRFTDTEMEAGWKIIQLGRARFQDCWELYINKDLIRRD